MSGISAASPTVKAQGITGHEIPEPDYVHTAEGRVSEQLRLQLSLTRTLSQVWLWVLVVL